MKYSSLLLVAALLSCGAPQEGKDQTGTESSSEAPAGNIETVKGFTVTIPEGWEVKHNYQGTDLMVLSPTGVTDEFRENFNVIIAADAGNMSLGEYYSQSLDYFRTSAPNFELLGEGKDKIDGQDTQWFDYKFDYSGNTVYGRQYYVLQNDKAFVITYSGTQATGDQHKDQFLTALKNVKLK